MRIFHHRRMAWVWLVVRVYVGWVWLQAGWEKVTNAAWVGSGAGSALAGFLNGALKKTTGPHPDVSSWYSWLITHVALPHTLVLAHLVAFGELAVGICLILGLLTRWAALLGAFMNFNYLLAGTLSVNPQLFLLEVLLIAAWKTAGWYGVDRFLKLGRHNN